MQYLGSDRDLFSLSVVTTLSSHSASHIQHYLIVYMSQYKCRKIVGWKNKVEVKYLEIVLVHK